MDSSEIKLEKLKFGIMQRISKELLDAQFDIAKDFICDHLVLRIEGFIWAEDKEVQYQEVKYPSNWKEALKERWFPQWMLSHFPVHYKIVKLDVKAIYPKFRPAIPKEDFRLVIRRFEGEESEWIPPT